jgi:hypothetical protein
MKKRSSRVALGDYSCRPSSKSLFVTANVYLFLRDFQPPPHCFQLDVRTMIKSDERTAASVENTVKRPDGSEYLSESRPWI